MQGNDLETAELDRFNRYSNYNAVLNNLFPSFTSVQSRAEDYEEKEYRTRRFDKEAPESAKREVSRLEAELKNIPLPDAEIFWKEIENYPCITHVTSPGVLGHIFKEGLRPVSDHKRGGSHSGFDEQFPELGLDKVVHCGWGGIDQFSTGLSLDGNVILLIKPQAVRPEFGVSNLDWTKWGAFQIYKYGGSKSLRDQVVQNFLRSIKDAKDFDQNPYKYGRDPFIRFLYNGWNADASGIMPIPTIFIPEISPQDIEGVIVGNLALANNQSSLTNIPNNIPQFALDDLGTGDIYGIERYGNYFAQISQRARFAEAKISGREQQFLDTFTLERGGAMDQYFNMGVKSLALTKKVNRTILDSLPPERL